MKRKFFLKPLPSLTDAQFAYLLIIPLLIFTVGIIIYPLIYSLQLSFSEINFVTKEFYFTGLRNYIKALKDPNMGHYLKTTLIFTFDVTAFAIFGGLFMALILNEPFKGRGILRALVLLPWAVSEYCTAVVWRYLYAEGFGLFNAILMYLGLAKKPTVLLTPSLAIHLTSIAYAWHLTPLIGFFLLAGLQTVPEELYRAAKIDGAGPITRFRHVTLPHLRYAILIGLVLSTMEAARATDIIILLTGGGPGIATETLTWHIYREAFRNLNLGLGSAFSYILIAIILVITIVYFALLTRRR